MTRPKDKTFTLTDEGRQRLYLNARRELNVADLLRPIFERPLLEPPLVPPYRRNYVPDERTPIHATSNVSWTKSGHKATLGQARGVKDEW